MGNNRNSSEISKKFNKLEFDETPKNFNIFLLLSTNFFSLCIYNEHIHINLSLLSIQIYLNSPLRAYDPKHRGEPCANSPEDRGIVQRKFWNVYEERERIFHERHKIEFIYWIFQVTPNNNCINAILSNTAKLCKFYRYQIITIYR